MKSFNKLSHPSQSLQQNLTLPTEEDITISFSKDDSFFRRPMTRTMLKNQKKQFSRDGKIEKTYECNSNSSDESTVQKKVMKKKNSSLSKTTLTQERHEYINVYKKQAHDISLKLEENQQEDDYKDQSDFTNQLSQQNTYLGEDDNGDYFQLQGEEQLSQKQDIIRKRMKQIDTQIRNLQMERNRLKYFLRKDKGALDSPGSQGLETKQCPCCGKFISKLCFRCEHLYCKVETCSRKKKQKLNARMLEKMKENKQKKGRSKRNGRSKQEKLQCKRHSKDEGQENNSQQELDDLSNESDLDISDVTDYEEYDSVPQPNPSEAKQTKQLFKMTLSQSLKDSDIFFDE